MRKLPKRPGGSGLPPPPKSISKPSKAAAPEPPEAPKNAPKRAEPKRKAAAKQARKRPRMPALPWRKWLKVAMAATALLVTLVLATGGYVVLRARSSLPVLDGSVSLPGLSANVEVERSSLAVPHLRGGDIRDLARAMGFVHAQDRLFQMELSRRLGAGRLAELFGPALVDQDRLARRLELREAAQAELERASPIAVEILESYASGVNTYRDTHSDRLSPELELLDLVPEPWTAADSLTIAKWFSYILSSNARVELVRARLVDAVGPESAFVLTGLGVPDSATLESLPTTYPLGITALGPRPKQVPRGASNAWVVDGNHSSSGRPLLASDPHLDLSMPSVFYEIRLSGDGIDVAGASVPGMPLVVFGQNRRIAWGITALVADVQDIYVETVHPQDPRQYAVGEAWAALESRTTSIQVKDEAPVDFTIERSRHGVVVGSSADGRKLAERWDAIWNGDHVSSLLWLNQAASWEEFTAALRGWASPALAFVYADVEGNIGLFPAGDIPVRVGFDGALPVDGSAERFEWQGVVPHDLKSRLFNPESGTIVSANHQMFPAESPYPLGQDALASFRAERIAELLDAAGERLTLEDFSRIQQDRYDRSTEAVLRYAVALRAEGETEARALELLRRWNGRMESGPAPLIYHALHQELLIQALADDLGEPLFSDYLELLESGRRAGLQTFVDDAASSLWDDRETPQVETREIIFQQSFGKAIDELSTRFGTDASRWDWGEAHGVHFRHPLGSNGWASWLLSRGPIPFGGSTHTIANAKVSLEQPFEAPGGTSFRFLADLSDLSRSRAVAPTGISGHPLSENYFDQNAEWLSGGHHALVDVAPASKLTLTP